MSSGKLVSLTPPLVVGPAPSVVGPDPLERFLKDSRLDTRNGSGEARTQPNLDRFNFRQAVVYSSRPHVAEHCPDDDRLPDFPGDRRSVVLTYAATSKGTVTASILSPYRAKSHSSLATSYAPLVEVAEIKQRLANGTYSDTKLTVKSYLEDWLEEKGRHVKPSTVDTYKNLCEKHVTPKLGCKGLDKVTPLDVQNLMGELADTTGIGTANAARTLLFSACKQALRWGLVSRNPVEATDPLKAKRKDLTLWSAAQAVHFLDTARAHRLFRAFYLVMATGLRRGELLGLRWEDVTGRELHIQQQLTFRDGFVFTPPKTARGTRRIAITPDVYEILEVHHKA